MKFPPLLQAAPRLLLIYKRSNLEHYRSGQNPSPQAYALQSDLRRASDAHEATLAHVRHTLTNLAWPFDEVRREEIAPFDESHYALVITVGGDGTLLSIAPYLRKTPVWAVNSAPRDSVGFFTSAVKSSFAAKLRAIALQKITPRRLTRLTVAVNGTPLQWPVLNDALFAHPSPAAMTRYDLKAPGARHYETHKSSGLWIATAAGSHAALRSAGGEVMALEDARLQYQVREAYLPITASKASATHPLSNHGFLTPGQTLSLKSRSNRACLYLDGHIKTHPIEYADQITLTQAESDLTIYM